VPVIPANRKPTDAASEQIAVSESTKEANLHNILITIDSGGDETAFPENHGSATGTSPCLTLSERA